MVKLRTPPPPQADIQAMRHFYKRFGAETPYRHCLDVLRKASANKIVQEEVVRDKKEDLERRWANVTLRRIALAHVLDLEKLKRVTGPLPDVLKDDMVMEELELWSKLSELDRAGAGPKAYGWAFDDASKPTLSILIKFADYAVTHHDEGMLDGFISNNMFTPVRQYASLDQAENMMKVDTRAGAIYAPYAEDLGYPTLAGEMFLHVYQLNHPEIFSAVMSVKQDPSILEMLANTQMLVRDISRTIKRELTALGFEVEVQMRTEKHSGKMMNKTLIMLEKSRKHEGSQLDLAEYLEQRLPSFDFVNEIHDWCALRVVVSRFRGKLVDPLDKDELEKHPERAAGCLSEGERDMVMKFALNAIQNAMDVVYFHHMETFGAIEREITSINKDNGYQAVHTDSFQVDLDRLRRVLRHEVQLKTLKQHWISESGGAAHAVYLGGDEALIAKARECLHLHANPTNGKGPQSRRSYPPQPS